MRIRTCQLLIVFVAVAAIASRATAQPIEFMDSADFENLFEGDDFPNPDNYASNTGGVVAGDGTFVLDHQDGGEFEGFASSFFRGDDDYFIAMTEEGGWTAEMRFQLDPAATALFQWQWRIGEGGAGVLDPSFHRIYRFGNDFIDALGGGTIRLHEGELTDGEWHVFRVVQVGSSQTGPGGEDLGDSQVFYHYLDGIALETATGGFDANSAGSEPWWGCGSGSCGGGDAGEVRIDHFRWTGQGGFIPELVIPPTDLFWAADDGGFWTSPSNWEPSEPISIAPNNGAPRSDNPAHTARFSSAITEDRTIINDADVTVNKVVFNNANSYVIVGLGSVSLQSGPVAIDQMSPPTTEERDPVIEVLGNSDTEIDNVGVALGPGVAGHHEIKVPVNLLNDTEVKVGNEASLSLQNAVDLGENTLSKTGGGALYINNDLTGSSGDIAVDGGTFGGSGTVGGDLSNNSGGDVAPGQSPGHLIVEGDYTQEAGSALSIELGGLESIEQYDLLTANNMQINGGTLEVSLIDGFTPSQGDSFDILNFFNLAGDGFDTLNLPGGEAAWDTSLLLLNGVLTCDSGSCGGVVSFEADFDGDDDVDGDDFLLWQVGFGAGITSGATKMDGDFDNDGDVDGDDFLGWQVEFPSPGSGAGSNAIPEPSTAIVAVFCLFASLLLGGRIMRIPTNRILLPLLAVLASLTCCLSASAQPHDWPQVDSSQFENLYEGDVFDTANAPNEIPGYLTGGFADDFTHSAFNGVLTADHNVSNAFFESLDWGIEADDAEGWTAEIRVRLDTSSEGTVPQLNWRVGDAENSTANPQEIYQFTNTSVRALQGAFNLVEGVDLSTDFHTLRVAQAPGQNFFYHWFDGQLLDATSTGGFTGGNQMWFGSGSSSVLGTAEIDYVRWTGTNGFCAPGADCPDPVPNQWNTSASGALWDDPDNWLNGEVPTDGVFVFGSTEITTSGPITVIVDNALSAAQFEINNANTMNFAGRGSVNFDGGGSNATLSVSAGAHQFQAVVNLNSNTDADIAADASLSFNDPTNLNGNTLTKTGDGALNINNRVNTGGGAVVGAGGSIGGSGSIAGDLFNEGSTVSPGGDRAGILRIEGDYTHDANSQLLFELGGLTAGESYDVLQVDGQMQVGGGTLEVVLVDGFAPSVGDSFKILQFGSAVGSFDSIEFSDGTWNTGRLFLDGSVTLVPEPTALTLLALCLAMGTAWRRSTRR